MCKRYIQSINKNLPENFKGKLGVNTKVFKVKLILPSVLMVSLVKTKVKKIAVPWSKNSKTVFLIGNQCSNKQENVQW